MMQLCKTILQGIQGILIQKTILNIFVTDDLAAKPIILEN